MTYVNCVCHNLTRVRAMVTGRRPRICCSLGVHRPGSRLGYVPDARGMLLLSEECVSLSMARLRRISRTVVISVGLAAVTAPILAGAPSRTSGIEPAAFQTVGGGGLSVGQPITVVAGQAGVAIGAVTLNLPDGAAV